MVVHMPVAAEHQVPTVLRAQRTVEVLKVFIDNVVDVRVMQRLEDDTPKREVLNLLVWASPALILTEDEDGGGAAHGASLENSR